MWLLPVPKLSSPQRVIRPASRAVGSPNRDQAVEVTDTFQAGVDSLRAHSAYIEGLGWADFDPAEFLEGMTRATGSRLGVPHAVSFEVFPMGWGD